MNKEKLGMNRYKLAVIVATIAGVLWTTTACISWYIFHKKPFIGYIAGKEFTPAHEHVKSYIKTGISEPNYMYHHTGPDYCPDNYIFWVSNENWMIKVKVTKVQYYDANNKVGKKVKVFHRRIGSPLIVPY